MSDWFESVKSPAPFVNVGLDLEMPAPQWRGEKLLQAVQRGEVAEATIDQSMRRLLQLLIKAGLFEHPQAGPEQALDLPQHRLLVREAAAEGIVLLKNERDVLPLSRSHLSSIAVIGPNARVAQIMGGGSAQVNAQYAITPFDGIVAKVGEHVNVRYKQGCTNYKLLPLLDVGQLLAGTQGTQHGLSVEYFNTSDLSGSAVWTELSRTSELQWIGEFPPAVTPERFSIRGTARFTPRETGSYTFELVSAGLSRLFIDGEEVIENWTQQTAGVEYFGFGSAEEKAVVLLEAGHE